MSAYPSLKHIQQRLVTFLRFIHRVIGPAIFRKLCTALLRHLNLSLRFFRYRWQILCEKQRRVSSSTLGPTKPQIDGEYESAIDADGQSQSTIDEQIVIPLDDIACALYPSVNKPQEGSGSQTLDTTTCLQSPEMLSPSRDSNTPFLSSSSTSSHISISVSHEPIYTTQTHFVSSPTTDSRRPGHHRIVSYRSDSTKSTEQLGSGEMSSERYKTLVAESSPFTLTDLSRNPSCQETLISSPTCVKDQESPSLPPSFVPVAPEFFKRHEKRRKIPREATKVTIKPLCTDFSDYYDLEGWKAFTHPEGGRYFHNAAKRIFTDVDLYDPVCLTKIADAITSIEGLVSSPKTDLVLDLDSNDDGDEVVDYYFANHKLRIVMFLEEFSSENLPHWYEVKGINSGTHLRHALEMQYWWHCAAYPNCIELSNDIICELRAIVMHFIMDCETSPYANSPYTPAALQVILSNTNSLKDNIGKPYSGCISFVGRLMFQFSGAKFLNFYGLPEARLNRDDSVHGHWTNRRTWFIKTISMFLFSAPDVHLRNLQKMWVDGIMHKSVWEESMKKVIDEWREFILYSTVLLNANVAFLAINSVDVNRDPYRSPTQISSYCSISASIGSIILGLILVRQNQTKHRETASEVQELLQSWTHSWLGLETLAIMFSLPYALLMWGMVSFLIAFWFMCLQDSDAATRSLIVIVCGVLLILIVWCICTSWEKQEPSNAEKPEQTLSFEEDHAKLKPKGFEFERDTPSQTEPTTRPVRRRSSTLSTLITTLNAPLNKIRRGTSKATMEVSVDEEETRKSSP